MSPDGTLAQAAYFRAVWVPACAAVGGPFPPSAFDLPPAVLRLEADELLAGGNKQFRHGHAPPAGCRSSGRPTQAAKEVTGCGSLLGEEGETSSVKVRRCCLSLARMASTSCFASGSSPSQATLRVISSISSRSCSTRRRAR